MIDTNKSEYKNKIIDWHRRNQIRARRLREKDRDRMQNEFTFRSLDIC